MQRPHPQAKTEGQGTAATRTCEITMVMTSSLPWLPIRRGVAWVPDVLYPGEEGGEREKEEAEKKTLHLSPSPISHLQS